MSSKLNPLPIAVTHFRSFQTREKRPDYKDLIQHVGVPSAVLAGTFILEISISDAASVAILTLAGIFAAFLFQLTIQFQSQARRPVSTQALLEELSANAGYAALVSGLISTLALIVLISDRTPYERFVDPLLLGLLTHLGVTLLMVVSRVFSLTRTRLNNARTGSLKNPR